MSRRDRYSTWLLGASARSVRQAVAYELQSDIQKKRFKAQTFEDLTILLDYEFFCVKFGPCCGSLLVAAPSVNFEPCIESNFLGSLLEDLCKPLITCLSPGDSEYIQYELQFRALLSTFTLLNCKGISAFSSEYHGKLQDLLQCRFKDLLWHRGSDSDLTYKAFLKMQCSYLLSATAEYFSKFRRAEPLAFTVASQAISLLSFGVSVSSTALGNGAGSLQLALNDLNNGLRTVLRKPDKKYTALFSLQELSRLSQTLQLLCEVTEATPALSSSVSYESTANELDRHEPAARLRWLSEYFTNQTLVNAMEIISQRKNYENNATPPPEYWSSFQAATSRGPPRFNTFYYLYGLVDCAIEVGKLAPSGARPDDISKLMRTVALGDGVPGHRWKALEYLLSSAGSPVEAAASRLLQDCRQDRKNRLRNEIKSLSTRIPGGDLAIYALSFQPLESSSSNDTGAPSMRNKPLSPVSKEVTFEQISPSDSCIKYATSFNTSRYNPFLAVGLSPDCNAMFTLDKRQVSVYSLASLANPDRPVVQQQENSGKNWTQAAISNQYIAVMSQDEVHVIAYDKEGSNRKSLATVNFRSDGDASPFFPRCLAIYDGPRTSWVVIAGEYSTQSTPRGGNGRIRIYRITKTDKDIRTAMNDFTTNVSKHPLIKYIDFCPRGEKLVAITSNNVILVWSLSENMRPPPNESFRIVREYDKFETGVKGPTSATIFQSPSYKSYVLCTTWPSQRRGENGGEWSYISPVISQPYGNPDDIVHDIVNLGRAGPITDGTASPDGRLVALREKSGKVTVFPLRASRTNGLKTMEGVRLKGPYLDGQDNSSSSSMRFRYTGDGLELFVVDNKAQILYKCFENTKNLASEYLYRSSSERMDSNNTDG